MNTVKKTIDIDLYSPTMQTIKAQQGDNNSRFIQFALFNQGEPYIISDNISVKMEGHRGDNSSFIKENCVVENNIITASIDEDILYASGTVEAKIVLYDISDNSILSAVPFRIHVQKNPCDKNKIEKEKKSLIDYLILTFEKFKENFNEHVADFQEKVTSINKDISDETTRAKAAENNIQSVINNNKPIWDDKYTKTEIDNKFSTLETNIDWKESVETYADIVSTYPNPQDGWTVNVKDTDYTYRYNGTEWVTISANAIPKATQSVDGLLSKEDKVNYDDANNKKHTHSNQFALDEITSEKILNWDNTANNSVTGVKGDAETSYRFGNVNITPADIGALSLSGGTILGKLSCESVWVEDNIYTNIIYGGGSPNTATKSSGSSTYGNTIFGGNDNEISDDRNCSQIGNSIFGGYRNNIKNATSNHQLYLTIVGGYNNVISRNPDSSYGSSVTLLNTIVGGSSNSIFGSQGSSIFGGNNNTINGVRSSFNNDITKISSASVVADSNIIIGGNKNSIEMNFDYNYYISDLSNTIVGGSGNKISTSDISHYLSIVGGCNNIISGTNGQFPCFVTGYANNIKYTGTHGNMIIMGTNLSADLRETDRTSGNIILGRYNTIVGNGTSTSGHGISPDNALLVVGGGTSDTSRKNAMRLTTSGYLYYNTGYGAGADYAEFFEWSDGNPNNEDRCGLFVTFDFENSSKYNTFQELPKIRPAQAGEYILGVISGNPSFVGNGDEEWKHRWLYDEFDRPIMQEVSVPITEMKEIETGEYRTEISYDEDDNEIEVQVPITEMKEVETGKYRTELRQVLNPEYDESKPYVSRNERKEWETTGLLGVLSVRDDGTCIPGKFCKCGENGIATIAEERTFDTFLVLRRVTDNIIKITFK